jgi:phage-related minor tail protein
MEDAITNFATTGKFSFKDFANSILADLVRMEVKILESKALASIFGSVFGAGAGALGASSGVGDVTGSTLGFAAAGGNIGGPTIVGEAGPELFVPNQPGTVVPYGKWQGAGAPRLSIVNNNSAGVTPAAVEAASQRAVQQAKAEIYNDISRGKWNSALRKSGAR